MVPDFLQPLVELSVRIGKNLDLVQAGGGNTSIKDTGRLWVKASGKWLSKAAEDDMFLPVPMADIERQLAAEDEKFPEYQTRSGALLRPSVETAVHAVLPRQTVIHVHSVRTIAWAAQKNGSEAVAALLSGLNWSWIPYTHPGIPLAIAIRNIRSTPLDVLILENHGLVVAAETCAQAEALLEEVERRLDAAVKPAGAPDIARLLHLSQGTSWQIAPDAEAHALATNEHSCQIAEAGTLFPDQCVYLGPGAAIVRADDTLQDACSRYQTRFNFDPVYLLVRGAGVLTKPDIKRSARELLLGLKRVIERIPASAQATYLPTAQVARLMNWDAEKYRIAMAQQESAPTAAG
jgi:rhamnose utilization protein RhaD (predicted bifunctional aldolase and dehydrogenase)